MRRNLTKIAFTALPTIIALAFPVAVLASGTIGLGNIPNPVKFNSLEEVINTLLGLVRPIVVLVFLGTVMYAGWVRLTAQDNADKVEQSTKIMIAAAIGFAIIVLAPVVVEFVGSLIGVQGGLLNLNPAK
jgi:heme/copper-type cytochrome/quinol oxidase subunit 2